MSSHTEADRGDSRERAEIDAFYGEIFTTAIDLLRAKGQPERDFIFFKYQVFRHKANSRKSEVDIRIKAGANLENASKISISIQDVGMLEVKKTRVKEREQFEGKEFDLPNSDRSGFRLDGNLPFHIGRVREYLNTLTQIYTLAVLH